MIGPFFLVRLPLHPDFIKEVRERKRLATSQGPCRPVPRSLEPPRGAGFVSNDKTFPEGLRAQRGKDAVERVVTGDAVLQVQEGSEPILLGPAEVLHVVEGFARAEQRADGDGQHVDQLVILRAIHSRVRQVFEVFFKLSLGWFCIPSLNHISAPKGTSKFTHASRLHQTTCRHTFTNHLDASALWIRLDSV